MTANFQVFPFVFCLVRAEEFPALQVLKDLTDSCDMACVLLDLKRFGSELEKLGEQMVVDRYLSDNEREYWRKLTSEKRKLEWLGGRFAVRYAGAALLSCAARSVDWTGLTVDYDKTGRPFLITEAEGMVLPDISISHSAEMAAAMAVKTGLCGLDLQKITPRVVRVRERFCTPAEAKVLAAIFGDSVEQQTIGLTGLWAVKEALRKVEKDGVIPGFLELVLKTVTQHSAALKPDVWEFSMLRKPNPNDSVGSDKKYQVILCRSVDYVLALAGTGITVA